MAKRRPAETQQMLLDAGAGGICRERAGGGTNWPDRGGCRHQQADALCPFRGQGGSLRRRAQPGNPRRGAGRALRCGRSSRLCGAHLRFAHRAAAPMAAHDLVPPGASQEVLLLPAGHSVLEAKHAAITAAQAEGRITADFTPDEIVRLVATIVQTWCMARRRGIRRSTRRADGRFSWRLRGCFRLANPLSSAGK